MRFVLLAAALLGVVPEPDSGGLRELAREEYVLDYFSDILLRGALWRDTGETAAFLVRRDDGELQCLIWPATNEYKMQKFSGKPPAGTIAIIHTHPSSSTQPSAGDAQQARASGLPIFVLTRSFVTAVDIDGTALQIVGRRVWLTTKMERRCKEGWSEPVRESRSTPPPSRRSLLPGPESPGDR